MFSLSLVFILKRKLQFPARHILPTQLLFYYNNSRPFQKTNAHLHTLSPMPPHTQASYKERRARLPQKTLKAAELLK
jgi:hypothetical protein